MSSGDKRIAMSPKIRKPLYEAMRDAAREADITRNAFLEKALEFYLAFGCKSISINGRTAKIIITAPADWH